MNSKFLLFLYSFFHLTNHVLAQELPQLNKPHNEESKEIKPLPTLEEILPEDLSNPQEQSPWEAIPGKITVSQFQVIGSTVFTEEQFSEILQNYLNKAISFAELIEVQNQITKLYQDKGYVTSGAFIPIQVINDGIVKVQVIEGRLEAIEIEGLKHLNPEYIRSRIAISSQAPLNQDKLLKALQLLQVNPLIDTISAELTTGNLPGTSILNIIISETNPFHATVVYDNYRSPSVGSNRLLGEISHDNLLGWGDRFNISYYHTEGSYSLDNLSYTFPINPYNGTLNASFRLTNSQVIEPEIFKPLDLESKYRQYELTYRQPIIQSADEELALGIAVDWQTNSNFLTGKPFPLSRGADNEGKTRILVLRFFQEYTHQTEKDALFARSQFSFGLNAFGATNNTDEPDSQFIGWRGQVQYLNLLTPDVMLLLRSDIQLANQALLPIEQFGLGGIYTVRGYEQDVLLADNGWFASAELRTNILKIPQWDTTLQLSPFFDFGMVWNNDNISLDKNNLASVGLGLRLLVDDKFTARFKNLFQTLTLLIFFALLLVLLVYFVESLILDLAKIPEWLFFCV
jgi:hemolysin activation/secretion protein